MQWINYNPNPVRKDKGVSDCAVRAVAKALDISWEAAYTQLSISGYLMGDMPNSDIVWGSILRKDGFVREVIPNTCPDCYSVEEFLNENPYGTFVIKSENHVATAVNGTLYDSWDSSANIPIYYWRRKEDY